MNHALTIPVIGRVRSPFKEKFGIPRQPNLVQVPAVIEFDSPYDDIQAFAGLEAFSHLWLIWAFHKNKHAAGETKNFRSQIRPPRLGGNQKIGVFASRSMYRPSELGLSVVRLVRVLNQSNKAKLLIQGADLLDGTPVVDIKPYIAYSDAIADAVSGFATDSPQVLQVIWSDQASRQCTVLQQENMLDAVQLDLISELLALDPRPAYQDEPERVYGMVYDQVNIRFRVVDQRVMIDSIGKTHG